MSPLLQQRRNDCNRPPPAILRTLAGYSAALLLPLCTLVFLISGPHHPVLALAWTTPLWLCLVADLLSPDDRSNPDPRLPHWPFDALLYTLAALQFANIALLGELVSHLSWHDQEGIITGLANLLAVRVLLGNTSCCSGIAVAHELIHRRQRLPRLLGRALLCTVGYAHFAVEHIRGHHRFVGTAADPATARLGESYREYWRRTIVAQWRSAWRLENERLDRLSIRGLQRWVRHEVLLGTVFELALLTIIAARFGGLAVLVFLWQALAAVRLLEAVNYFQHWGLVRDSGPFLPRHAWTTDSWFTRHAFLGLSRHADHHTHAARPYFLLNHCTGGLTLPYGYFGMAFLAKTFNRYYQNVTLRALRQGSTADAIRTAYRSGSAVPASPASCPEDSPS
jgi:alkane 1-monooxygenase